MTHLLIKNDVVVNAIIAGEGYAPPAGFEILPAIEGVSIGWRRDGGSWLPPGGPVDLYAYAATRRREIIETARIDVGGVMVPTDVATQNVLTAGFAKASANSTYEITDWKVGPGQYTALNAATIIALANAVESFVQTMFSRNRAADTAIAAGTATTTAHVDAILEGV